MKYEDPGRLFASYERRLDRESQNNQYRIELEDLCPSSIELDGIKLDAIATCVVVKIGYYGKLEIESLDLDEVCIVTTRESIPVGYEFTTSKLYEALVHYIEDRAIVEASKACDTKWKVQTE